MKVQGYAALSEKAALEPFEYESPELGQMDVRLEVVNCGICYSDIHIIDNDFGISQYPFVPGHEVIGHVADRGPGVKDLREGDRVGVGWQGRSCMKCEWCLRGEENHCPELMGSGTWTPYGGFATSIVVDSRFAFPLPQAIPSEDAGPLLCGGTTVYAPLRAHGVQAGARVGVIGIGGLGHMAVQFARARGCHVTAFSSTPAKEKEALAYGASEFALADDVEKFQDLSRSLDVLLFTAHADIDWNAYLTTLRPKGKIIVVGFPDSSIEIGALPLVLNELEICGSIIGDRQSIKEMLDTAASSNVRPKVESLPMAEVNKAIKRIKKNEVRYRVVLTN